MLSNEPVKTDAPEARPDQGGETANRSHTVTSAERPAQRRTVGGGAVQGLLLALVAAVGFGGGYLAKDRQDLAALEALLERQAAAQDQIATLEQEVLTLERARSEEERRRATIVEVDLQHVFGQLRDSVADTALARFDDLAADITAGLAQVGHIGLRDQIEAAATNSMSKTDGSELGLPSEAAESASAFSAEAATPEPARSTEAESEAATAPSATEEVESAPSTARLGAVEESPATAPADAEADASLEADGHPLAALFQQLAAHDGRLSGDVDGRERVGDESERDGAAPQPFTPAGEEDPERGS